MTHGRYLVTGNSRYLGQPTGQILEAALDPATEARAIARGALVLLERFTPSIQPGTYRFPAGWLQEHEGGR